MKFIYPARLEPQPEGGFSVVFPDFPDAITEGDTRTEALEMAADCLAVTIAWRINDRDDIPLPSKNEAG